MEHKTHEYTVHFRLTTEVDKHLESYDHTKLSAINVCPTWGILRYQMHKSMPHSGRAMALECGSAMHEVFSFIRLVSLCEQLDNAGRDRSFIDKVWVHHGSRLFGLERITTITDAIKDATDVVEMAKIGSITVLDTSGFYDDPRDRRRTLSNMEECAYAYINRWRWDSAVWMRDNTDPTSDVGIEIPFDLVVDITGIDMLSIRLTGRIDGIHHNTSGRLTIHDNKTASRLTDAWATSFALSHQVTGYCVAASVFTQQVVNNAEILGLAIPLPRGYDFGGYVREPTTRQSYHYDRWLSWLVHTIRMTVTYRDDPYNAPKYTHSCNRYFRPCSFIPFCDSSEEDQRDIVDEMEHQEWSPLDKPILDGVGNE